MDNMDLEEPVGDAQQLPAAGANNVVKLPVFWTSNPAAWFANADAQFALRGITCQRLRYLNTITALPEATVNLITDLVETEEIPADAYTQLKARLYGAHQLSDNQRVEQLFGLPTLGDRKPSELLAEMSRICPRGQDNNLFFTYCFLHRLPREICVRRPYKTSIHITSTHITSTHITSTNITSNLRNVQAT